MDLQSRRQLLATRPNPDTKLDYIVFLEGHIKDRSENETHIQLRYIPDRHVLSGDAFGTYLDALAGQNWESPEDLAVTILSDFTNQLIARWAQVSVSIATTAHASIDSHGVVLEDRQPNWDNPTLLSRLQRV